MPRVDSRSYKILIADDNVQNVELLEAYLAELDCTTSIACDGEETLAKVKAEKPDLILLDIMMPKMSGFEVCRRLKGDVATREIQILMITSLHETADIDRGVEAGTDDFLTKPVQKQILLTRVKSLLKVRHLQSELERTLSYLREVEGRRSS
jgi:PleD family two-component response regulator